MSIESVRCFGERAQTLNLRRPSDDGPAKWTIILGDNGSGKTTLLQCLAAFAENDSWLPYGYWRLYEARQSITPIGSQIAPTIRAKLHRGRLLDRQGQNDLDARIVLNADHPPESYRDHVSDRPVCFGYGAWRRTGGISFAAESEYYSSSGSGEPEDDGLASLYEEGHALRNAESWLLQLDYGALKPSEVRESQVARLAQVKELLVRLLPGVKNVRINAPTLDYRAPSVEFETIDGWVPLDWTGYGYRNTVAWVVDLASRMVDRYPESADPLSEPAVVFVDEIDLHLHPLWQRTLMDHLSQCFPTAQFVVTAHSPLFVQAAAGANLVVLRRDGELRNVVIDNDVDRIANWRIDQILTSDLFGLATARPPQIEEAMRLRKQLLEKPALDAADRKRLAELETQIGGLPTGESSEDVRTRDLLKRTLQVLRKENGNLE